MDYVILHGAWMAHAAVAMFSSRSKHIESQRIADRLAQGI